MPSAPPPGASPYLHKRIVVAKRLALGLEPLVRIPFPNAKAAAEPFFDWCRRHPNYFILSMQLRKERVAPFFHEYVTFRLKNRGGCFRIDRRQRPDLTSPMKCAEETGSEAYDTIEEIVDMEDSMYNPSDCLVHIDLTADVHLCLITDFCNAMSKHERASVYTVQRYNCYFYAQSMILYVLCWAYGWTEDFIWYAQGANDSAPKNQNPSIAGKPLSGLEKNPDITIRLSDKRPEAYYKQSDKVPEPECYSYFESDPSHPLQQDHPSIWRELRTIIRALRGKTLDSSHSSMKESSIGELQDYFSDFIQAHSVRVEQYKALLKCNALEVERDIKVAIDKLWEGSRHRVPMLLRWKKVNHEIWYEPRVRGIPNS